MNAQIKELAVEFKRLKEQYDAEKETLDKTAKAWAECEEALLGAMAEEGVKSLTIEGVGMIMSRVTNYLSVNAENKPRFYQYLKESGNGALLKEDVNPRTLTAFLKGHLEEKIAQLQASEGLDIVDAREKALAFLNERGANYFTKRDIALKGAKDD